jgi:hypothetical protein
VVFCVSLHDGAHAEGVPPRSACAVGHVRKRDGSAGAYAPRRRLTGSELSESSAEKGAGIRRILNGGPFRLH